MRILRGSSALTPLRVAQLHTQYHKLGVSVQMIAAEYIYWVGLYTPLCDDQLSTLTKLLGREATPLEMEPKGRLVLVLPRCAMVSPWSIKATNIVHNCGLTAIKRLERGIAYHLQSDKCTPWQQLALPLYDSMTEQALETLQQAESQFYSLERVPKSSQVVDLLGQGKLAIEQFLQQYGLELEQTEVDHLITLFTRLKRNPYDIELFMFSQTNSEHCRHKIFNAQWIIDGIEQKNTLFSFIKNSYHATPDHVLSAYRDNAAVVQGKVVDCFFPSHEEQVYRYLPQLTHLVIKVETHNHPTALAPKEGAATGCGGEIRDEAAVGLGGMPKAGLVAFSVSHLRIPGFTHPWEQGGIGYPPHLASALQIMLEAPLGAAAFNNEFGRPSLLGYWRTYEQRVPADVGIIVRGYHKPIMLSGGLGYISDQQVHKKEIPVGAQLIVLGGAGMKVGLGGGRASSTAITPDNIDMGSTQRANPEMERRCQEVINRCWQLGTANPILFIHDVGAGGLANAFPELLQSGKCGGQIELRDIPAYDSEMSPLEIWCNEAQERYVLAIAPGEINCFAEICKRERTPYAVVGIATETQKIVLMDRHAGNCPIDLATTDLLDLVSIRTRSTTRVPPLQGTALPYRIALNGAIERILRLPAVAEKAFLIHIADRSVGGLVARDQLVGPWQIPVADCAVTLASFNGYQGEVMAIGERSPVALLSPVAASRLAVGEALTNLAATNIGCLKQVKLSANWMAAVGHPGEEAALYDAVQAVGESLCPSLGLTIPVGKDSLSMQVNWQCTGENCQVVAPLTLVISAFAPVEDVRKTVTPQLQCEKGMTHLLLIDLGEGHQALGATALAQVYQQLGDAPPDVRNPQRLGYFFHAIQQLVKDNMLLAYHDRSDGGLFVTLAEMAFAGHCGVIVDLPSALGCNALALLFNEELGAVIQVHERDLVAVERCLSRFDLQNCSYRIGSVVTGDRLLIRQDKKILLDESRHRLRLIWGETSWQIERLRDDPECADQAWQNKQDPHDPGLNAKVTFTWPAPVIMPTILRGNRPRLAVLREQGINSHIEMAAAFDRAGFTAIDVHMSDLLHGYHTLADFSMVVACGGFSYGDVLGSGQGWAKSIILNPKLYQMFHHFFQRQDTLTLGVCNGCQMLATLREMIPGAEAWPTFSFNRSERFEARLSLVEITKSPSLLLQGMRGSRLPIVIAHSEGRVVLQDEDQRLELQQQHLVAMHYVDNYGFLTERYPANPNGSPEGMTAFTTIEGRVLIMMPHPERVFRTVNCSWNCPQWGEESPWMQLFYNARSVLG